MRILITLLLTACVALLHAGGFQINEHGAKAMAMGNAFTAVANDASAVYFNPAGICFLGDSKIMGGFSIIKPEATFRGPLPYSIDEYKLEEQYFNPINFYYTTQLNEDFAFGFAVNNPFGMGTKWEEDWVGKYLAIETELRTFFFTPAVSFKIYENFSFGASISYVYADVLIKKAKSLAPFDGEDAIVELTGDDNKTYGYSFSLMYKPLDNLSLGLNYKSQVDLQFEGEADIEAPSNLEAILPYGDINANLDLPANLLFGVSYNPIEELTIALDYQYVWWSSYDEMKVTFTENEDWTTVSERDYDNSYILRGGVDYSFMNYENEFLKNLSLRCGLFYDNHPVKDNMAEPSLPDSDRLGFNYGLGYTFLENFNIDLAYLFLRFDEKKINDSDVSYTDGFTPFNGVYNAITHVAAINLSYKF
ncbi:MAG: outer membrane protein transport protein [Candidatus Delongbacteria bacterium]|nr:outer membrane protein transport protein [Candidatus Delongbacteria bacterium]MBN2835859.1 outer membrane protein transport protein [Candidatus Delongbacteria bacterium]